MIVRYAIYFVCKARIFEVFIQEVKLKFSYFGSYSFKYLIFVTSEFLNRIENEEVCDFDVDGRLGIGLVRK